MNADNRRKIAFTSFAICIITVNCIMIIAIIILNNQDTVIEENFVNQTILNNDTVFNEKDFVYSERYTINSSLPIEYYNDSCMGARMGNIYIATKERNHYGLSGIILRIYNQENTYRTFMYASQCGINEHGLFYACASINAVGDLNSCNHTSNFSSVKMLQTCKNIPEVKQYINSNPILSSATMLICDKEGRNLKIQSLCNKTIMLENNNTFESVTNYPFICNEDFKIKRSDLHSNGLAREQYLSQYFDSQNNILSLIKSENISQIGSNNVAGYYTLSAMVVDGDNVYIYYGCPTYNKCNVFSLIGT